MRVLSQLTSETLYGATIAESQIKFVRLHRSSRFIGQLCGVWSVEHHQLITCIVHSRYTGKFGIIIMTY